MSGPAVSEHTAHRWAATDCAVSRGTVLKFPGDSAMTAGRDLRLCCCRHREPAQRGGHLAEAAAGCGPCPCAAAGVRCLHSGTGPAAGGLPIACRRTSQGALRLRACEVVSCSQAWPGLSAPLSSGTRQTPARGFRQSCTWCRCRSRRCRHSGPCVWMHRVPPSCRAAHAQKSEAAWQLLPVQSLRLPCWRCVWPALCGVPWAHGLRHR